MIVELGVKFEIEGDEVTLKDIEAALYAEFSTIVEIRTLGIWPDPLHAPVSEENDNEPVY